MAKDLTVGPECKVAVKVDQQVGFVTGRLANPAAAERIPYLTAKAKRQAEEGFLFYCTLDTHAETEAEYLRTQEGKKLPVWHCGKNTPDWEIVPGLKELYESYEACFIEKPTYGSETLVQELKRLDAQSKIVLIEVDGFVTNICDISNVLMLKAAFPEVRILFDAAGSAGTSEEGHRQALSIMRDCQVEVINA